MRRRHHTQKAYDRLLASMASYCRLRNTAKAQIVSATYDLEMAERNIKDLVAEIGQFDPPKKRAPKKATKKAMAKPKGEKPYVDPTYIDPNSDQQKKVPSDSRK